MRVNSVAMVTTAPTKFLTVCKLIIQLSIKATVWD